MSFSSVTKLPGAAEISVSASFVTTLQNVLDEVAPRRAASAKEAEKCFASLLDATLSLFAEDSPESLMTPVMGYGVKSAQGMSKHMEDSYSVQTKLSSPGMDIASRPGTMTTTSTENEINLPGFSEDLAFFSVFDGHGGDEVAQHCSERLHQHFTHQLIQGLQATTPAEFALCTDRGMSQGLGSVAVVEAFDQASRSQQQQQPDVAPGDALPYPPGEPATSPTDSSCPSVCNGATPFPCDTPPPNVFSLSQAASCMPALITEALRIAFLNTDAELEGTDDGEYVGTTAVVAIVAKQHIWVAHAGDSRAVISRSGDASALTSDHKPDRPDEEARIVDAGGRIVSRGGASRVMGMLAMTRAIGDHYLRPYVIAEPEVSSVERGSDDELLILATDGLWDVFSMTEASALANRCIARSTTRGMSRHGACRVAATVLAKAAMDRGSRDNITVIVVDISLDDSDGNSEVSGGGAGEGGAPPRPAALRPPKPVASSAQADETAGEASTSFVSALSARSSSSVGRYVLLKSGGKDAVAAASGSRSFGPGTAPGRGALGSPTQSVRSPVGTSPASSSGGAGLRSGAGSRMGQSAGGGPLQPHVHTRSVSMVEEEPGKGSKAGADEAGSAEAGTAGVGGGGSGGGDRGGGVQWGPLGRASAPTPR
ncbi:hypothetical protein FOA52_016260 [Chlamydomonas sp. UWO 241]|nr:hypothetical protein FOA52_016260 [Chlamydomonas sp. UWO 241]